MDHEMCFDFLYNLGMKHFPFREESSEILSYMYMGLHVKYPLFVSEWYLNFLGRFSKNTEISNFMKIGPVEAELFPADRPTDMTKLTVVFLGICERA